MQVRSLASLDNVTSSSRVLNLNKIYKLNRHSEDYSARPIFTNPLLNRSIIVKHRLRPSERRLFTDGRNVATKVLLPLETMELKMGAQSIFVGEKDFENKLSALIKEKPYNIISDVATLNIIDDIPSLDSYLLIENFKKVGIRIADCYLNNSQSDNSAVQKFIMNEVSNLSKLISSSHNNNDKAKNLGFKLMSTDASSNTEELRQALKLEKADYAQGLFFWKAIIFYKWQIQKITPVCSSVFREMNKMKSIESASRSDLIKIKQLRNSVALKFANLCSVTDEYLYLYDAAYNKFLYNGNHTEFRTFLIESPFLFKKIGESFNDVAHIVNFWRNRAVKGHTSALILAQLTETLQEFDLMSNPNPA